MKNYRFYDEREWRYVPEFQCAVCELKLNEDDYRTWRGKADKPRLTNVSLDFNFEDIEYLYVSNDNDIKDLSDWLYELKKEGLTDEMKTLLIKKIKKLI